MREESEDVDLSGCILGDSFNMVTGASGKWRMDYHLGCLIRLGESQSWKGGERTF